MIKSSVFFAVGTAAPVAGVGALAGLEQSWLGYGVVGATCIVQALVISIQYRDARRDRKEEAARRDAQEARMDRLLSHMQTAINDNTSAMNGLVQPLMELKGAVLAQRSRDG